MTSTPAEGSPYLRLIVLPETLPTLIERLTARVAASSEWRRDEAAEVEWAASVDPQQPPVYSFVVAPAPPGWTHAQRLWLMPDKRGDDLIANTIFPEPLVAGAGVSPDERCRILDAFDDLVRPIARELHLIVERPPWE